jgi:hypothetical protein
MAKEPKAATQEQPPRDGLRAPFWSGEPIPIEQLMEEQGITEPQGLDWLPDLPSWPEVDGY